MQSNRKLKLARATLKHLSAADLHQVAGGPEEKDSNKHHICFKAIKTAVACP